MTFEEFKAIEERAKSLHGNWDVISEYGSDIRALIAEVHRLRKVVGAMHLITDLAERAANAITTIGWEPDEDSAGADEEAVNFAEAVDKIRAKLDADTGGDQ